MITWNVTLTYECFVEYTVLGIFFLEGGGENYSDTQSHLQSLCKNERGVVYDCCGR